MTIDKILFRLSKEIIESNTDHPYLLGIPKRGDLLAQRISNNLLSENFKHDIGKVDYLPFRDDLDKNLKKNNLAISPKDREIILIDDVIYTGRTLASIFFIMTPMTVETVILFSIVMGGLWLATVPLTSGVIGYIYGMQYMGTLYGIVFLSHQIGSFVGIWLGGSLYDMFGNYNLVWWVGIGVGAFSAVIHMPVREIPIESRLKNSV